MKGKILLVASGVILAAGAAMHIGNKGECPMGKPCQKIFKKEATVKADKTVELAKAGTEKTEKN